VILEHPVNDSLDTVSCFLHYLNYNLLQRWFIQLQFLPCNAVLCMVLVIVILSVRLSVHLSDCHTRGLCPHMVRPTTMISSPYGSPIILVSGDITFIPKFEGGRSPRARALNEGGVGRNWRFSTNKPPYLWNGARYDKGYYWSLIGNRIRAFDWYQINDLGWPWNDLGRQLCTPLHYTRVLEPTTKIYMKIDPYYQRQKCSPGILVSSKVSFMRIFAGVRWKGGIKWQWGGRKLKFSLLSLAMSS